MNKLERWDLSKEKEFLKKFDKETLNERAKHLSYLIDLYGKSEGYFLMPVIAHYYLEEAKSCYINGNFVASICMSQIALEELLKFRLHRKTGTFKGLIDQARNKKVIAEKEAEKLHELRNMRNPYAHVESPEISFNWYPPIESDKPIELDEDGMFKEKIIVERHAQKALRILIKFIKGTLKYGDLSKASHLQSNRS